MNLGSAHRLAIAFGLALKARNEADLIWIVQEVLKLKTDEQSKFRRSISLELQHP